MPARYDQVRPGRPSRDPRDAHGGNDARTIHQMNDNSFHSNASLTPNIEREYSRSRESSVMNRAGTSTHKQMNESFRQEATGSNSARMSNNENPDYLLDGISRPSNNIAGGTSGEKPPWSPVNSTSCHTTEVSLVNNATSAQILGEKLHKLHREAIDVAILTNQEALAKKTLTRRQLEFRKTSAQHESFPATAKFQKDAIIQAERELLAIKEKYDVKAVSMGSITQEVVRNVGSFITGSAPSGEIKDYERLQNRCEALEKSHHHLQQKFLGLHDAIESIQKEQKEQTVNAVALSNMQRRQETHETRLTEIDSQQNVTKAKLSVFNKDLQNITERFPSIDDNFTNLQVRLDSLPKDLAPKILQIDGLSNRVNEFPSFKMELSKHKKELKDLIKPFAEQTATYPKHLGRLAALDTLVTELAEAQRSLGDQVANGQIVSRKVFEPIQDRLVRLENRCASSNPLGQASESLSSAGLSLLQSQNATLQSDLQSLVERMDIVEAHHVKSDAATKVEISQKELDTPEEQSLLPQESGSLLQLSNPSATGLGILQAAIKACQEEVEKVQAGQDAFADSLGPILAEPVNKIESRISSLESSIRSVADLSNRFEILRGSQTQTLHDFQKLLSAQKIPTSSNIEHLQKQPESKPCPDLEQRLFSALSSSTKSLHAGLNQEIQARFHSLESLEARVNNINTGYLANHILDHLSERFPNLQRTEASLAGFRDALRVTETGRANSENKVKAVEEAARNLEIKLRALQEAQVTKPVTPLVSGFAPPDLAKVKIEQERMTIYLKTKLDEFGAAIKSLQAQVPANEDSSQKLIHDVASLTQELKDVKGILANSANEQISIKAERPRKRRRRRKLDLSDSDPAVNADANGPNLKSRRHFKRRSPIVFLPDSDGDNDDDDPEQGQ